MPRVEIFCIFIFVSPVVFEIGFLRAAARAEKLFLGLVSPLPVQIHTMQDDVRLVENEVTASAAVDHSSTSKYTIALCTPKTRAA